MSHPPQSRIAILTLAALGVVYGDIGTSPLYALRECFSGTHALPLTTGNMLGVLSMVVWSLIVTVTLKYLLFVMRADNGGEGGILALVALVRSAGRRGHANLVTIGLFGAALLYGDGMITPSISVLSAVEGLGVATHVFDPFVLPIAISILVVIFFAQSRGTEGIGKIFGPIMIVWFSTLFVLALPHISQMPVVLQSLHPRWALAFLQEHRLQSFATLGSVFLAVTGGEALYADMGHFGARPIRLAWFSLVLPALTVNYFGQGALMLAHPELRENPFFYMAPAWGRIPLVLLATMAAIIASQAVISGAFSLTQQAIQLGYSPRFNIRHTSEHAKGQVYVPEVNWFLMVATVGIVLSFRSSANIAAAYGMGVSTTMVITTILAYFVVRERWGWNLALSALVIGAFFVVDLSFFAANAIKIPNGGWFPLLVAAMIYAVMSTWSTGRQLVVRRLSDSEVPLSQFFATVRAKPPVRVPGTGIFMTARPEGAPPILVHHLTHNKVLHEQVILLTVAMTDVPTVNPDEAIQVERLASGFWRVVAKFGFMDQPDVPAALNRARSQGLEWRTEETTFYLAHLTLFSHMTTRLGMSQWRDKLFVFLSRNARSATSFFQIPPDRVVEIGIQLEM